MYYQNNKIYIKIIKYIKIYNIKLILINDLINYSD